MRKKLLLFTSLFMAALFVGCSNDEDKGIASVNGEGATAAYRIAVQVNGSDTTLVATNDIDADVAMFQWMSTRGYTVSDEKAKLGFYTDSLNDPSWEYERIILDSLGAWGPIENAIINDYNVCIKNLVSSWNKIKYAEGTETSLFPEDYEFGLSVPTLKSKGNKTSDVYTIATAHNVKNLAIGLGDPCRLIGLPLTATRQDILTKSAAYAQAYADTVEFHATELAAYKSSITRALNASGVKYTKNEQTFLINKLTFDQCVAEQAMINDDKYSAPDNNEWYIPTDEENGYWYEKSSEMVQYNGVIGRFFGTTKIDGTEGHFFPATGTLYSGQNSDTEGGLLINKNIDGGYWYTSTPAASFAWTLWFNESVVAARSNQHTGYGRPVRCVKR